MNHDLGLGAEVGVFDGGGGGVKESCDVVEVVSFAEGPEEACCDLVADGDDVHGETVAGEGVAGFKCVVVDFPGEVVDVGGPAGGGGL